ncbi:hypothetical protein [Methylomagnum sp.]
MNVLNKLNFLGKKTRAYLLCAAAFSAPLQAASLSGIVGNWGADLKTKLSVSGFGVQTLKSSGLCVFSTVGSVNAAFSCNGYKQAQGQSYSGISVIVRRGKQMDWYLNPAALDQVQANVTKWLVERNLAKGRILDPSRVTYEFDEFNYKPIKIADNLDQPVTANLSMKGRAIQFINGKYEIKSFSYTVQIQFLARVP